MSEQVMTLVFTDISCKRVIDRIEESGTDDPGLIGLANAMRPNAMKVKRGAFMAYVRESDDEIFPGFRLSDHALKVDRVVRP